MSSIPSLNSLQLIRIYEFYYPEVRYLEVAYSGGEGCVQMLPTIDKSITATLDHRGQYEALQADADIGGLEDPVITASVANFSICVFGPPKSGNNEKNISWRFQ